MTFDPVTDVRRLLNDFTRGEFDDRTLGAFLTHAARQQVAQGFLVQEHQVLDLTVGVKSYALPPRWIQTFAVVQEEVRSFAILRDQTHTPWVLMVDDTTDELTLRELPMAGIDLTADRGVYWLRLISPNAATWYVYPEIIGDTVQLTLTNSQPSGAGLVQTLELRQPSRHRWLVGVSTIPEITLSRMAGTRGTLRAPDAPQPRSLPFVHAEGLDRYNPDLDPGPPDSVTIWQGRLWVSPTPDAAYQLDHKYFAAPVVGAQTYEVPAAFARLPVFFAMALALRSEGRAGPATMVSDMAQHLLRLMAQLYHPGEQDSRDEAHLPA